jgi:hypothetical protein
MAAIIQYDMIKDGKNLADKVGDIMIRLPERLIQQ